jgi:hypothetical protein
MDYMNGDYSLFPLDELKLKNINKPEVLDMKRVYSIYNTCSIKTIIELKTKLNDKYNYIEMGISVLYYIFFLVLRSSKNMKLCLKLSERAILLFTEFIIQSKEKKASGDLVFNPSIADAVSFAYKKTIGSITLNKIEKDSDYHFEDKENLKWIMKACETMDRIYLSFSVDNNIDINILQTIKMDIYTDTYYLYEGCNTTMCSLQSDINSILETNFQLSVKWIILKCYYVLLKKNATMNVNSFIDKIKNNIDMNKNIELKYAIELQTPFYEDNLESLL